MPDALSAESSVHPWFCHELARRVAREDDAAARGLDGLDAEALRLLKHEGVVRRAHRAPVPLRRGRGARAAPSARACGRSSRPSTPAAARSRPRRRTSTRRYDRIDEPLEDDRPGRADPRLRPEPHRPGHRVRLLLRAGRAQLRRAGLRGGDGQLQSRDRLDRLRHRRPPVLRAAHGRGRARGRRARAADRRRRAVRRPDAAQAGAPAGRARRADPRHAARRPSTSPRTASASATCSPSSACARRTGRSPATPTRPSRPPSASATRCSCGRPTCSAAARCASATRPTTCARRRSRPTRSSTASSRTRSRSTSTPSATAPTCIVAAVMEHVEEAGVHSGDSACVIPPLSIGPELEAEIRRQTELLVRGLGVQGLCNVQFALHEGTIYVLEANPRASRTVPFVCKAMGIDLVDLACRVTTGSTLAEMNVVHPRAARRRGQGGRAPVRALPGLRPGARAGDALDRRGDGARARLRHDVRQGHARGRAASARAAERPPRRGVPLGLRPRQARRDAARPAARRPRLRPRAPRRAPPAASSSSASR